MIEVGDVSGPLSALYVDKQALFGGSVIKPQPPLQITIITDALRWGYEGSSATAAKQRQVANYLYWMCGLFQLEAQNIISGPGGGSVIPIPSGGGTPNDIDFIVSSTSVIATDDTFVYFDGSGGRPDLRGYDIDFYRGGLVQYTTQQPFDATYYRWNNITGLFQLFPTVGGQASEGESFRISPKTGGGYGSVTPTQTYPFIITSADFESDGVTYLNVAIDGDSLYLLANNVPNPMLTAPTDFVYVSGGIQIVLPGFDANTFDYTIAVNKIN
jgi:hypothetical protein